MDETMWAAIGSVGTCVAVVVAVITIVVMQQQSAREVEADRAAELREIIRAFKAASDEMVRILLDGSGIIAASEGTIRSLQRGLGDSPSVSELWALLAEDSQVLSATTVGWTASPVTSDLRKARAAIAATSERLSGELNLLSSAGYLIARIADDGYSQRIFTILLSDEGLAELRRDSANLPLNRLLWELTSHLQANTSAYFHTRYGDALDKLQEFIDVTARALSSLTARDLVRAARSRSASTYTDEMRANLESVRPLLPDDVTSHLGRLIDDIEQLIAKDGALYRAPGGDAPAKSTNSSAKAGSVQVRGWDGGDTTLAVFIGLAVAFIASGFFVR